MSRPAHALTATIPAAYGLSLLDLMAEQGHDEQAVLAGSGLSRAALQGQQGEIGSWQYGVLLANATRLAPDGSLPYELGMRSQVTRHGFVGFGLMSCATLREAIEFGRRYFRGRLAQVFDVRVSTHEQPRTVIELIELIPLGPFRPVVLSFAVVELCHLFARILHVDPTRSGWTTEVWVPYPEPPAHARYQARLPRFHFNAPAVQIRFPAALLDMPIATADVVSRQLAAERCEQELARRGTDEPLCAEVMRLLVCKDGRYPDVAALASELHLSERTLKRRLQEEGTSYQQLLDRVRHQDSMRLLANPALAVKQVAEAVGYADPANFARAFAKWTGLSPREWRQRQQPLA